MMFEFEAPRSTEALRGSLENLHQEMVSFLTSMPEDEFLARQGDHWSPAEHVRHLVTAVKALTAGMAVPKLVLALRFGVTWRGSRTFEEVRDQYRSALAAGGQASGRYDPAARPLEMAPEEVRPFVIERWTDAGAKLDAAIESWREGALDRHRAKHPLLGMMTVRELLYFTLYHNAHHARRIEERRA